MTDYHRSDRSASADSTFTARAQYNSEEKNSARQAAEALFAPNRRMTETEAPIATRTTNNTARRPRILSAVQAPPIHAQHEIPVAAVPPRTPKIPMSHLGRIRTWLKYGMTIRQVANVYGVATDDLEHLLQKV